ncbi:MFS transporter [Bradyrhizobium uaiense]|uniref:CynX/NimT family MFS transporter n=1 Tax=Bradyrhizobium uaiense TaxID=2594946 RepID=A0A6P1BKB7_9BRAD|nr:MFS transporter [Bradyrhizobium uaiense]NEU98649.1 CynX/NimT family MFS transporter [Bradyrhizobium uaiense]
MTTTNEAHLGRQYLLVIGILTLAASLRAPFTLIGPLLDDIQQSLQLSTVQAGALTTIPLLMFAFVSPAAAALSARVGLEKAALISLSTILVGIALRLTGQSASLYFGTAAIGAGIAVGNVILPGFLKRSFPDRIPQMTTVYVLTMTVSAAVASALAIPLAVASGWGWRFSLGIVAVLPVLSLVVWLFQTSSARRAQGSLLPATGPSAIWRNLLAWQVTAYLGLTVLTFYVAVAWLPAILAMSGFSATASGNIHGLMHLSGAAAGLLIMPLISRFSDQRLLAFLCPLIGGFSLAGLIVAPNFAVIWIATFGFVMGAALILSLAFISLRSSDAKQAATLSGLAQCVGYLLAAAGPPFAGFIHDLTNGWTLVLWACVSLTIIQGFVGLFVGSRRQID